MSKKILVRIGVAAAFVALAVFVWFMISFMGNDADTVFENTEELVLLTYEGEEVRLADFKKKTIIAHSWASWCVYCAEELDNLARLKEIYGDGVVILAINRAEPHLIAKDFSDKLTLPEGILLLLDPNDAFYKHVEGYAMPETMIVNEKGEVLFHQHGPLKFDELVAEINALAL